MAKGEGRDPFELLALTAIQRKNDVQSTAAANAMKLILDVLTRGESRQQIEITKQNIGPTIYLPEEVPEGQPWVPTNLPGKSQSKDVH